MCLIIIDSRADCLRSFHWKIDGANEEENSALRRKIRPVSPQQIRFPPRVRHKNFRAGRERSVKENIHEEPQRTPAWARGEHFRESSQCFRGLATVRTCFFAAHSHTLLKKNIFFDGRRNVNISFSFTKSRAVMSSVCLILALLCWYRRTNYKRLSMCWSYLTTKLLLYLKRFAKFYYFEWITKMTSSPWNNFRKFRVLRGKRNRSHDDQRHHCERSGSAELQPSQQDNHKRVHVYAHHTNHRKNAFDLQLCHNSATAFRVNISDAMRLFIFNWPKTRSNQIRRKPIECQVDPSYEKYTHQIETRCWIEGSYIIREHLSGTIGKNLVNYGIGTRQRNEERIYQTYYQWVTPTLLIMAMIFYFPQFLWHNWEGGTMEKLLKDVGELREIVDRGGLMLIDELNYRVVDSPYVNDDCWNNQRDRLVRYLHGPKRYIQQYAIKYYTCEIIALVALVRRFAVNYCDFANWFACFRCSTCI